MSDGNEGDGEAAAEEEDEHGGQPVTVVNSEWQVAAWGLNSFLCWPLERWGGEPPGGHEGVTDESHLVHCKLWIELVKFED